MEMSKEFKEFLKEEGLYVMFKMLPKPMKKDIIDEFNKLKNGE